MTEKRFYVAESKLIDGYCVFDREKKYAFCPRPRMADCLNDAHTLNELTEENEQLKQGLKTKCIVNKQYEENQRLIKMLDNIANYMQKEHRDMPIDDFVEWWNNIATEGL